MDRLLEAFENEFAAEVERQVAAAFKDEHSGVNPILGDEYIVQDPRIRAAAMRKTIQALLAKRFFEQDTPKDSWAPTLPIRREEQQKLIDGEDPKQKMLGYYARSLRWIGWRYRVHPTLEVFGRAVMAARRVPVIAPLQNDFELRQIFYPPQPLGGFNAYDVNWQPPCG